MDRTTREEVTLAAVRAYFKMDLILNEYDEFVMPREDGNEPDRYAVLNRKPKKMVVSDSRDRKLFTILCHDE